MECLPDIIGDDGKPQEHENAGDGRFFAELFRVLTGPQLITWQSGPSSKIPEEDHEWS